MARGKKEEDNSTTVEKDLILSSSSSELGEDTQPFQNNSKKRKKKNKKALRNGTTVAEIVRNENHDSLDNKRRKGSGIEQDNEIDEGISSKSNNAGTSEDDDVQRKRLYFPNDLTMDYSSKLQWAVKLNKRQPEFEVLFKEGKYRPYITVKDDEAVNFLVSDGFENVILEIPKDNEKRTKVIVFNYPIFMDPEDMLVDDRVVWAKRREVKRRDKIEDKPQVIALLRGEAPERIFVPCIGYRKVAVYNESPILCLRCSRWGHMAYKCQNTPRCRFCSKFHDSRDCAAKIKENIPVISKCCNCGEAHNANSTLCVKRPQVAVPKNANFSANIPLKNPIEVSNENVWERRLNEDAQRQQREDIIVDSNPADSATQFSDISVITALRQEIEELKGMVMAMQSKIVNICSQKDSSEGKTNDMNCISVRSKHNNQESMGEENFEVCKDFNQSEVGDNSILIKNHPMQEIGEYGTLVETVTCLLDRVVEYMQNPKDDFKASLLGSVQQFRDTVQKNGGS